MEWKEVRLGDVCSKIGSGATPSGGKEAYKGGDYHLIRSQNVLDFAFSKDGLASINDEQANKLKNVEIIQGDVLLNITGDSVARCCIVPSEILPARVNQHVAIIRPRKEELDKHYLLYYLQHYKRQLLQIASAGATRNAITKAMIENLILPCPKSLDDQRRIASILSSLDRKIELNNKINADLEEMAQAIFKNWFVDFEPFEDGKFVNSELGMIPEGWKVSQIADIPHILETGKRPKGGAVEKGIPSVGAEHVKGMCAYDYSKTKYINCEFAAKLKTGKINGYELMIYKDGGKPGYFIPNFSIFGERYPFENCYLNEHVFKLDFDGNKEFNIFCYFFFKTEQIMSYFNAQGAKAAIPGINKKDVENIYIFSPDNESVIKFGEFAYPLFKQMLKNAIENRRLSLLRDTLLPRLMSGEIEVPQ